MYHLDPVGRLTPRSIDVSRAAAVRHAHVSALGEPVDRPRIDVRGRRLGWFHLVAARLPCVPA